MVLGIDSQDASGIFLTLSGVAFLMAVTSLARLNPLPSEIFRNQTPWRVEEETVGDVTIRKEFYLERKGHKLFLNNKTGETDEVIFNWVYQNGGPQEHDLMVQ